MVHIGFSNVFDWHPFAGKVRENLEQYAAGRDGVTLTTRDNAQDTDRAIANSEEFAALGVDVGIVFHIDQRNNDRVAKPLRDAGIPIICVDIPIERTVYYGLDNERVGREAGEVLSDWVEANWDGTVEKTLVIAEQRLLRFFQQRFLCVLDVMAERLPGYDKGAVLFVDNGGKPEITTERVGDVLDRWEGVERIGVVCMNDEVAVGTLRAIYDRERQGHVALASHDGTEVAMREFEREDSPMVVSTKLYPERYGRDLIELGIRVANGERVKQWNYTETFPLTPENYLEHI